MFVDPAHIVLASVRPIDGEDRYKAAGIVGGKLSDELQHWGDARVAEGHFGSASDYIGNLVRRD